MDAIENLVSTALRLISTKTKVVLKVYNDARSSLAHLSHAIVLYFQL